MYVAVFILVVEHLAHSHRVHGRVPRHVGHEDQQRINRVGIAAPGVGDDVVHQAVHGQRMLPGERLVDAHRAAILIHEQVVRFGRPAERHAVQRRIRLDRQRRVRRFCARRNGAREWCLVAETAGTVDGAEQRHQNRQRADGVETVGVRRQPAHGVKGHGVAGDGVVFLAPGVGPGNRQHHFLVARGDAHLIGQAVDGLGGNAGDFCRPFRRVVLHPLMQQAGMPA